MRFVGFIGPSYTLSSKNVDSQRCVNWYPELDELGTGKEREIAALIPTPGLSLLTTLAGGAIRGEYSASNGRAFVVSGNKLYEVFSDYTSTLIQTLTTSFGPVSMADSGPHLAVVDGSTTGYMLKFSDNTVAPIAFPTDIDFIAFKGCDQVLSQDGYFLYKHKNTGQFFISGIAGSATADDTTIDALDFNPDSSNPQNIIGFTSDHKNIWLLKAKSTEVYYDSGAAAFPFQSISGAFIEVGCAATFSVANMSNTVYWLGQDAHGSGMVFQATGYAPTRISTHALELAIQGYGDISGATAFTYQERGHYFYVISFPNADTSWAYDSTTKLWHERAYTNQGQLERHRAGCHMFAFGKHIVGDYQNGNLYEMSSSIYSDNGAEITKLRRTPHQTNGLDYIFYGSFQLDMETGVGLDGLGQGVDPKVMLRYSDDGGHSWSNEIWVDCGRIGQTKRRAIWRRLGRSRDRVFEIKITDPVKSTLIGAELHLLPGAN